MSDPDDYRPGIGLGPGRWIPAHNGVLRWESFTGPPPDTARTMRCADCDTDIHWRRIRCQPCAAEYRRARNRAYMARVRSVA